jgi:hypothetical protein|tara:strand:- start:102 stop:587 length:486 start_codon:yes stop_codon:yes gene_type:complete
MACYIREAHYAYYVEEGSHITEIVTEKFVPGIGMKQHREWLYNTAPTGNWTHLTFEPNQTRYDCFLDCMVKKTLDIRRRLCRLALDSHDTDIAFFKTKIRLMNAIKILDPTFEPPVINRKCGWQNELLNEIYWTTSLRVIATCINEYRLERYFSVVRSIGL